MTKRNDLEREVLMVGSGFCKKLSIKGLYAESVIWKYLRELGGQCAEGADPDQGAQPHAGPADGAQAQAPGGACRPLAQCADAMP